MKLIAYSLILAAFLNRTSEPCCNQGVTLRKGEHLKN